MSCKSILGKSQKSTKAPLIKGGWEDLSEGTWNAADRSKSPLSLPLLRGEIIVFTFIRQSLHLLFLLGLCLGSFGFAQQQLVINGQPTEGLTTSLAGSGSSYLPAETFADALGARYYYDAEAGVVTFDFAGQLLSVSIGSAALTLNGRPVPGEGAVVAEGVVYVPLKPLVQALGGSITYLASRQTVMVVFPRATLQAARLVDRPGEEVERFVFEVDALTNTTPFFNAPANTLQLRFERTDIEGAKTFSGDFFTSARLRESAGAVEFRVTLEEGYRYESYTVPRQGGFSLVVDVFEATAEDETRPVVVLDSGHGGSDAGVVVGSAAESDLTSALANELAQALGERDLEVRLTRQDDSALPLDLRSQGGIGADLFISLHGADLVTGQYNAYYLGDGTVPYTELAMRENAEAALASPATDELRRQVLLNLLPDLSAGERYARTVSGELAQVGFQTATLTAAPLLVLGGAAGRGVLFEFSLTDLASGDTREDLVDALTDAITDALAQGGDNAAN